MSSGALFVIGLFACFQNGDSTIASWSTPTSTSATATGTFTSVDEQKGDTSLKPLTGLNVTAEAAGNDTIGSYAMVVNPFDLFAIPGTTVGTLNLAIGKALDYEFAEILVMTIKAIDNATADGTATMTLTVLNVVADDPTWPELHYCVIIPDGTASGTTIPTTVQASSGDSTITYASVPSDVFTLSSAGSIVTAAAMNRAVHSLHQVTVTGAISSGLTSSTLVTICVGSSTQCAGFCAATCSSATAITINIMTILSLLLLLVVKY